MAMTNETTPLLSDERVPDAEAHQKPPAITPLPKLQLAIITCIKLVEPLAYELIFPYINEYVRFLRVTDNPQHVGFYSGLVESAFAFAELFAIYHMAKLSDRVGRRPVLFFGVGGVGVATILFGLSTSFAMLLAVRVLAGLCSGNTAVALSVVGELTDASNVGLAMSIFGIAWPVGAILGPLLGGALADPAARFRWLDWPFLRRFPYFLPGAVSGAMTLAAVLVGFLFLEETLPRKRHARRATDATAYSDAASDQNHGHSRHSTDATACSDAASAASDEPHKTLTMRTLLAIPAIFNLAGSGFALSFLTTGFDVLFVLYASTAIENGGLGFSPATIGYALSASGVFLVLLQVLLMPRLLRTFDKAKMYNLTMWLFLPLYPLLATLNPIARSGYNTATGQLSTSTNALLWAAIALLLGTMRLANLGYGLSAVLVKEHCPNPASLGVSNGAITFVMSLARATAPTAVSSMFAFAVAGNLLGGFAWMLPMLGLALGGVYQSTRVVKMRT
ncbi:hypothetical protein HWV62_8144 [Athelia sp. TMB]|nr:hypothetical protein HWV62_8144 [Athelia sp. TMB]